MPICESLVRSGPKHAVAGFLLAVMLAVLAGALPAFAQNSDSGLRARVEALAARQGFAVVGLEQLESASAGASAADESARNLESLLDGYNYLLVHRADGGIRTLRILGVKPPAGRHAGVRTRRQGAHQLVETVLVGPNGVPRTVSLILDTGASTIVLPHSMIEVLGFKPGALRPGTARTANGPAPIQLGALASARVGLAMVRDVAVGFIADDKLGGQQLLGMSFLNRFQVTIDDEANRLILLAR